MAAEPVVGRNNFPSPSPGASSSSTTLPCLDLQTKNKKKGEKKEMYVSKERGRGVKGIYLDVKKSWRFPTGFSKVSTLRLLSLASIWTE